MMRNICVILFLYIYMNVTWISAKPECENGISNRVATKKILGLWYFQRYYKEDALLEKIIQLPDSEDKTFYNATCPRVVVFNDEIAGTTKAMLFFHNPKNPYKSVKTQFSEGTENPDGFVAYRFKTGPTNLTEYINYISTNPEKWFLAYGCDDSSSGKVSYWVLKRQTQDLSKEDNQDIDNAIKAAKGDLTKFSDADLTTCPYYRE